ncbi:amine oxidase catalytic domain-containing protein [Microthyrium microscopicum]|uniref:Amine oxidase n=1 Tax=Microthyrium microscopicum TaxID=703497 RepID=A0A6A6UAW3_9PEZI|nr:amine oxidase catalytic domain-containing protein [Microthyrium microscopicum]
MPKLHPGDHPNAAWRTRWPLYIARLPPFPLFVTIFLTVTVLFFSFMPHNYRKLPTLHNPSTPISSTPSAAVTSHGDKQNPGRIRTVSAPRANVWRELGRSEVDDVVDFVKGGNRAAGVPKTAGVVFVERLMPNKTDVLPFLADAVEQSEVGSYARVVMLQNKEWGKDLGGISEWMVGPLPVGERTTMQPLSYCYNSGRNHIRRPVPDIIALYEWFNSIVNGQLKDLMQDLLGETPDYTQMTETPGLMGLSHPSLEENLIVGWITVQALGSIRIVDAFSLLPQGMYAKLEVSGFDVSKWNIANWYYDGVLYNSTNTFYNAWKDGRVRKSMRNADGDWTAAEPTEEGIEGRERYAPMLVQPYGPRVEIDEAEKYVKWMGWEFYLTFSQVAALSVFDIRFRGERIMYELGMQEAMAHYAGGNPSSSGQLFFDTMFGFGLNAFELVPGYDCPAYATFLPVTIYREGKYITKKNVICVFEAVSDHALQRHTSPSKVTVSRNSYLVVRSVSSVGNYDYTTSYLFYLDGSVEVKIHASGYIFTDYLAIDSVRHDLATRGETQLFEYGYRIHDVVASSMHTHILNFKADLDIAGTANTLYKVDVEPITRKYEWEDEARNTMHLVHTPQLTEAGLDWPRNSQGLYVVLNNASTNAWGEKRGYKIVPGTGMGTPPHLAMANSTAAGRAADWALHDLFVLRQHDSELKSVSEWNGWERDDPLLSFGKMVNGESTSQEDLVVYFNLGVHHLSNSADVPNTLMHWSGTSVMFVPHNYHDRDPSRESAQGMRIKMGKNKVEEVTYYGARYDKDVFIHKEDIEPEMDKYSPPGSGISALSHNATF